MNKKLPLDKIPLFNTPDKPLWSTTQDHLPVADIQDGVVLYKDGGAAMVLESTSLNFGLLSDREQEAVVAAYAALINSLSFSIQVVIRTQRKDITHYIKYIDEAAKTIKSEKLAFLMSSYRAFVIETTKKRNVLGKRFFLVIPFSSLELGIGQSFKILTSRKTGLPYTKDYVLKKAKVTLFPKRDHLIRQGARLGLRMRALTTEEITELYYNVYNPPKETVKENKEAVGIEVEKKQKGEAASVPSDGTTASQGETI
jgi:hypothetical protein